jgi:hypothetical protein
MVKHAIQGNAAYLKELFDRVEGPVSSVMAESGRPLVHYVARARNPRDGPPPDDRPVIYIPDNGRDPHPDAETHNGAPPMVD